MNKRAIIKSINDLMELTLKRADKCSDQGNSHGRENADTQVIGMYKVLKLVEGLIKD